mmetsp:Transcript_26209/g.51702  ORF Transcript_26209/g.51702 Transcript_26209/m.51702 type:complete len:199 (-) Transcript_26209:476-1072(-)
MLQRHLDVGFGLPATGVCVVNDHRTAAVSTRLFHAILIPRVGNGKLGGIKVVFPRVRVHKKVISGESDTSRMGQKEIVGQCRLATSCTQQSQPKKHIEDTDTQIPRQTLILPGEVPGAPLSMIISRKLLPAPQLRAMVPAPLLLLTAVLLLRFMPSDCDDEDAAKCGGGEQTRTLCSPPSLEARVSALRAALSREISD